MDGFDADAEWSEDDVVKSGSATALSDTDCDDPAMLLTMLPQQLLTPQCDPASSVLDKIDAELGAMNSIQAQGAPRGLVENLTNDKPLFVHVGQLNQSQEENSTVLSPGDSEKTTGTDTGLGTGSLTSSVDPAQLLPVTTTTLLQMAGQEPADTKKNQSASPSLNFLAAKEVDDKFQEVLRRKRGGYLENLQNAGVQSDQETIRTEDFEAKFNECLIPVSDGNILYEPVSKPKWRPSDISDDDDGLSFSSLSSLETPAGGNLEAPGSSKVKTSCSSDLEVEFDKALAKLTESLPSMNERRKPSLHQRSYSGGAVDLRKLTMSYPSSASRKAQLPLPHRRRKDPRSPRRPPSGKPSMTEELQSQRAGFALNSSGYNSDLESIKTEDFETIFQNLLVKQGPNLSVVNHMTFDPRSMASSREANSALATILKSKDPADKRQLSDCKPPAGLASYNWTGNPSCNRLPEEKGKLDAEMSQKTVASSGFKGHSGKISHNPPGLAMEEDKMLRIEPQSDVPTDTNEQTDEEIARNAREIEQQSILIQKELEFERRMKQTCLPGRNPESCVSVTHGTKNVDFDLQPDENTKEKLDNRQRELNQLDESIKCCHADLKRLETMIKDSREQAEDARTQLMLTEFKRDNALKELDKSTQELFIKRKKVKAIDDEVKVKMEKMKEFGSLDISKDEVQALIKEREVFQSRVRNMEALQLERNELVRQLEVIKQNLFSERKNARQEKEELLEETESVRNKLEEIQGERDELHQNVVAMEMALQKMETEKAAFVQEKAQIVKDVQEKAKRESFDLQQQTAHESEQQSLRFGEMAAQLLRLGEDVRLREEAITHLRCQLESAAQKLLEEHQKREAIQSEHRKSLQNLRKDTDVAVQQVRESCFLEKQQSLEGLRQQLEEERRDSLTKCEDRMTRRLAETEKRAAGKDDQIQKLEDQIREIKMEAGVEVEKIKQASDRQAQAVIWKERQVLENEREWIKQREREAVSSEMKRKLTSITEELECRDNQVRHLKEEIQKRQKELEEQKELARESVREKLLAVARVKDQALTDRQTDMDRLRETVVKENKAEIQKLREMIDSQGEELSKLRKVKVTNEKKQKDNTTALDRTQRTLINEINEECRRTAAVLGLTPREINISNFRSENGSEEVVFHPSHGRKVTTSALANLRACNEELRGHVIEMSQVVESQRAALLHADHDKNEAIEQLKRKMEREKLHEMDDLKERLIKDHVEEINKMVAHQSRDKNLRATLWQKENVVREMKHDVRIWKEEMTQKFTEKLQQEISKRQKKQADVQQSLELANVTQQCEIDRLEREVARLAQNQNRLLKQSAKVKTEYNAATAVQMQMSPVTREPTITLADAYEQRAKHAEKGAEFAEGRANHNEARLSHKMTEMNKLQSTLSHQSKELRQLERAYNQLRDHSHHLSAVTSPPPQTTPIHTSSYSGPSLFFRSPSPSFGGRTPNVIRRPLSMSAL